ncbi:MAG: excinuclease ABC subunit B [Candidatus Yanofskybacteria bacterium CG10_big_fil_rev_8_21_14_0_10_46_23]|uniref:UvrABC system protein B n=1 Tax=Candidatus Yanofskybacteria bacterium CG10_big_fil_rev_8_21_14_0_10_46_23 TaxID=1975098 RepID=A0A2H0R4F4_9BACT|nr:MAG: excinuclease ABC subunit B [Candidatus Yanofskybacteria bacterium CG10_big_fil_rev_8_21_14_0_10_46_23]
MFKLHAPFKPTGDQPEAIKKLLRGIRSGEKHQTLLGVTGSGKTFTIANLIEKTQRPTLVISPNKTLAAQLYQEFKEFFPDNSVHYFVSFYDYYQPEAYLAHSDTYIEKDARINEEIDRLRHSATQAVASRDDVIIVASVSCIYNLGSPEEYQSMRLELFRGQEITTNDLVARLQRLQYQHDIELNRGGFRKTQNEFEIASATGQNITKIRMSENKIAEILVADNINIDDALINPPKFSKVVETQIYPAKYWITRDDKIATAIDNILAEMQKQVKMLSKAGETEKASRLRERTERDMEMLRQTGYCYGIENYSRHLDFRKPGEAPHTLIDFFRTKKDFLTIIDESHITIPQIRGMYHGDHSRKSTLITHGFRLPSAIDNRPLKFPEFKKRINQSIFVSATPGRYEQEQTKKKWVAEQIIRPTGLTDPTIEIRPTVGQIEHLLGQIQARTAQKQRVLVTTLTKRMAEDLTEHLAEKKIRVNYIHSDVKTLDRVEIINDLRKGTYDVIVGVNLLREGLDLPEVSLIAILDADKEGFLRNTTTLIQTMGRAARNLDGHVIMYADKVTKSMTAAIEETNRRRVIQEAHNRKNKITPSTIKKRLSTTKFNTNTGQAAEEILDIKDYPKTPSQRLDHLQREIESSIKKLQFERALRLREQFNLLRRQIEKMS